MSDAATAGPERSAAGADTAEPEHLADRAVQHHLRPARRLVVGVLPKTATFRAALRTGPVRLRLAGGVFALASVTVGVALSVEAQLVLLTVGLAAMLIAERWQPAGRERRTAGNDDGCRGGSAPASCGVTGEESVTREE